MDIKIILPPRAQTRIDDDLVDLTRRIWERDHAGEPYEYGLLGGEFGYGAEFANDVFVMRPFWWGKCTCSVGEESDQQHEDICRYELPNFQHFASGLAIDWYKWIGREMEFNRKPNDWKAIIAACHESLAKAKVVTP